ncbi:MAG: HPr family phosphocarrier protein [Oscillospiraceae bacterium]|nr:HPr family phosphocarrier protein [Oscillospiraceae bacterium]
MVVVKVKVRDQVGLHARPATYFIQEANKYKSLVWIERNGKQVSAKSLLGILSLGIFGGVTIKIIVDGPDEKKAAEELKRLIETGFAEQF